MRHLLLLLISPFLFVTEARAQDRSWLFASLLETKTIVSFERNPQSGELVRRGETTCPAEPACMGVSPDRRTLFVSFRSTGQLASLRINPENGRLKLLSVVEGGEDPAYLLPDKSGKFLLSAYYQSNKVCVHRISEDGSLSAEPVQTIPTAEKAHGIVLDTKNDFAFVTHTGANRIYQFRFDNQTGHLTANDPPFLSTDEADHPRHIALHPTDKWAYVSNEAGDSVGVYQTDREQGTLEFLQRVSTIPEDFDGRQNSTARCEMTPDGRFVYVANRGHDSIAGFAIDQKTGRVTSLGQTPTEQTPRSFTIDSNGKFLYAAGQGSGKIAAFRILDTGKLERFATYDSGPVSWWVVAADPPESERSE